MAISIGQKRNTDYNSDSFANCLDNNTTFSTTIHSRNIFGDTSSYPYDKVYFEECGLKTLTLSSSEVYYLTLILNKKEEEIDFNIKLQNEDNIEINNPIQSLKQCTLYKFAKSLDPCNYYDVVFTPNSSIYNRIVFCINRLAKDVLEAPRTLLNGPATYHLYSLNNLITEGNVWKKMGIQTRPGSLVVVNKLPIRIGRSGIYELNNGSKITDFRIASNSNNSSVIDPFLIDYVYTEGGTNS